MHARDRANIAGNQPPNRGVAFQEPHGQHRQHQRQALPGRCWLRLKRPTLSGALEHGFEFEAVSPVRGRLEYKSIPDFTDPTQRIWVWSSQNDSQSPWKEQYCFAETEFLPQDYEVMNMRTMTSPTSFFVKTVVATRTILDEEQKAYGVMILHKDYVKARLGDDTQILTTLTTEEQESKGTRGVLRYRLVRRRSARHSRAGQ